MRFRRISQALAIAGWVLTLPLYAATPLPEVCPWSLELKPRPIPVAPWSIQRGDLSLVPMQIFPPSYLRQLKGQGLSIGVKTEKGLDANGDPFLTVLVGNASEAELTVLKFKVRKHAAKAGAYVIEGLRAEHPQFKLSTTDDGALSMEYTGAYPGDVAYFVRRQQERKGIPYEAMAYALNQMKEIIRGAGGSEMLINDQGTYVASKLLMFAAKMEPTRLTGAKIFAALDRYYSFARHSLPPELRIKNLEAFQFLLDQRIPSEHAAAWRYYLETGRVPENAQILKDSRGRLIGIAYLSSREFFEETRIRGTVYFVDPLSPTQALLDWPHLHPFDIELGVRFRPQGI